MYDRFGFRIHQACPPLESHMKSADHLRLEYSLTKLYNKHWDASLGKG